MSIQRLSQPQNLDDLFLYALSRLLASAGGRVIRLCEGEFGITRREWRFLALLAESDGILSSALAASAQLDRARTSRTRSTNPEGAPLAAGLSLRGTRGRGAPRHRAYLHGRASQRSREWGGQVRPTRCREQGEEAPPPPRASKERRHPHHHPTAQAHRPHPNCTPAQPTGLT